jgi:nucleoside-diphosphate-sugar epimerase
MAIIAVTGGSGKLGVWVIKELLRQGDQVVSLDERTSDQLRCKQLKVNLSDLGQVVSAMHGMDAVIHLAAIPSPNGYTSEYIFANNVRSTYNVLEAASMLGIAKLVTGSSESAYGFCWAPNPFDPLYLPVDEEHSLLPQESYGLSKIALEQTGAMFHRRTGMQIMALRYSMITTPDEYEQLPIREPRRLARILWSYIDIRDAVQATIASLHSDIGSFHALNITSDDTLSDRDTEQLLNEFYPNVADLRQAFSGRQAIVSNERAKKLLRWAPTHTWETSHASPNSTK